MYAALQTALPEHLALAASPQLAENSRLGFAPVASTSQWASGFSISSNTLGLSGSLYDGRIGSCSTGKERDAESGNDYFGARYYASSMGRWLSPDWSAKVEPVPYAKLDNPQSLNLYSYVLNNPLKTVDKDGHVDDPCKGRSDCTVTVDKGRNQMTVTQTSEKTVHTTDKDGNSITTATKTTNTATFSTNTGKFITATTQTTTATTVNGRLTDVQVGATTSVDRQTLVTHMSPEVFNGASKMAHVGVDSLRDTGLLGKEVGADITAIGICAGTAGIGCGAAIGGDAVVTTGFEVDRKLEKKAEADE